MTEINANANYIIYDNSSSGNTATNVQSALDELFSTVQEVQSTKGALTGTGITVTNGEDALLKDVTIGITPGSSGQVMITDEEGRAAIWVDQSQIVPTTAHELENDGENTLTSTVNGVLATANLVNTVVNSIADTQLVTTVNGVASEPLELRSLVQSGQKTVSLVDGENTVVSSTVTENNTEYKVNVSAEAIQAEQKTTVVEAGTGIAVTAGTEGNETTYTVAVKASEIALSGDVSGTADANTVEKIQGTVVSATTPTEGQVLTYDEAATQWVAKKPTVDVAEVTNGQALSSTDLEFTGEPSKALLSAVHADIKTGAVTSEKILDGTIQPIDLADAGKDQVLVTNSEGKATWMNQSDLVSEVEAENGLSVVDNKVELGGVLTKPTTITASTTQTLAVKGLDNGVVTDKLVVTDAEGVLKQVKAAMPKFFYMPSILLDTENVGGEYTVNLYQEFVDQFTNIPANQRSTSVADIPFVPQASELDFYVTYVDQTVIEVLEVNAAGQMKYRVIANAKSTTFANIVFVVK